MPRSWTPDFCLCGHAKGDHQSNRTTFPHPLLYGVCLQHDCDCREFRAAPAYSDLLKLLVEVADAPDWTAAGVVRDFLKAAGLPWTARADWIEMADEPY